MKILSLQQSSPEWHAHRAAHFNASDAPAMLGSSPYKTRSQLLRELATGVGAEVDAATQRRFDDGHRFEALARPLAEQIVGEELFPCVAEDGLLSASFDGLTLDAEIAFEHKTLNDDLRAAFDAMEAACGDGSMLPLPYRVQMEQQCMVSGASRVLFMASKWDGDRLVQDHHCWYRPDADLRAQIAAGWSQFATDLATFSPEPQSAPAAAGRAPDQLPALRIEVTGMVTASNLAEFKATALDAIRAVNRELTTDDDFADAEQSVKWCGDVESRIEAAKQHALSQTRSIDELFRTMDEISAEARRVRLDLDKLVKSRKESIRAEIIQSGRSAVVEHVAAINRTLGEHAIGVTASLTADLAAAIKGKRTLSSMRDAVDTTVASAKIAINQLAERIRGNIAVLAEHAEHGTLFPDRVSLCATKQPDDLRNLIATRIADHEKREADKLEAERERIRAEEEAKAAEKLKEQAAGAPAAQIPLHGSANITGVATGSRNDPACESVTRGSLPPTSARIKLGDINAVIAPLSITAEGLASIGYPAVATDRAAKLYAASDLPEICALLSRRLAAATQKLAA